MSTAQQNLASRRALQSSLADRLTHSNHRDLCGAQSEQTTLGPGHIDDPASTPSRRLKPAISHTRLIEPCPPVTVGALATPDLSTIVSSLCCHNQCSFLSGHTLPALGNRCALVGVHLAVLRHHRSLRQHSVQRRASYVLVHFSVITIVSCA